MRRARVDGMGKQWRGVAMQKETDFRNRTGFESHGPEGRQPAVPREEDRYAKDLERGFGGWLRTFRDCMAAGIRESRQSRIGGLTKRCHRD